MDLPRLIEALTDPAAWPSPPRQPVEIHQTHLSVVFLVEEYAWKLKKPVRLDFVDYSTPAARLRDCEQEVQLNSRLAPGVYQGVVPIVQQGQQVRAGGEGTVIDWLVQMVRLPDEALLKVRLEREEVHPEVLDQLALRLADFHAGAERSERIASFGRFEIVAGNARGTLSPLGNGAVWPPPLRARLESALEAALEKMRPVIEGRAARGIPCDTHGDLRLEHVYLFPDRPPPENLVIIDCISFNERFRFSDPMADVAFLVMELLAAGRPDLAESFRTDYVRAAGDAEGAAVLPFYTAYRALVRSRVEALASHEAEIPPEEQARARARSRQMGLLALAELEQTIDKPCLVLVAGLPGSGKTTLANALAARAGLHLIRTDVVRKELAAGHPREDLYTPEWDDRTYAAVLERAHQKIVEGGRVLIDANFRQDRRRQTFLEAARDWGVPAQLLICRASPEVVRRRLLHRTGDASDADWIVYQQVARTWEPLGTVASRFAGEIDADGTPDETLLQAVELLEEAELL
jgi:aminoglycoside phosphotransferase family enzyme/predicted kinase